jgi:hypothetical protein
MPTKFTDLGIYNVRIVLTTPNEVVYFPFKILVTNTPPRFTKLPESPINMLMNN